MADVMLLRLVAALLSNRDEDLAFCQQQHFA
jgi:hypothetical protein